MLRQIDTSFLLKPNPEVKGQGWGYLDPDLLSIRDMWEDVSQIVDAKEIIEIGMFAGHSTVCLLEYFPNANVASLDNGPWSQEASVVVKEKYGNRFNFTKSRFIDLPLLDRDIDLLFVDGGHSFDSVSRDISKILKEKPRYILFDNVELPGVRAALKANHLFKDFLNPQYWFYINKHKGETCPGILMLVHMEGKYDEILRLL